MAIVNNKLSYTITSKIISKAQNVYMETLDPMDPRIVRAENTLNSHGDYEMLTHMAGITRPGGQGRFYIQLHTDPNETRPNLPPLNNTAMADALTQALAKAS